MNPSIDGPIVPAGYDQLIAGLPFLGRLTCDQSQLTAGHWYELLLKYDVGSAGLADGAWLKITFRFYSDWGLFQTEDPAAPNYVSAELKTRPLLPGETPNPAPMLKLRFDQKGHERPYQKALIVDLVDGYLRPGDQIIFRLGDRRGGSPGTRAQSFIDDDFRFRAYIDPVGTSRFAPIPGDIVLKIVAGEPAVVRTITPRLVRAGDAFPVTMRAEDAWGNACNPAGLVFQLHGAGSIPLELYPDAGRWAAASTRVTFTNPGSYALHATLADSSATSIPAPVTVDEELQIPRIFFADLHVHSSNTVGTNSTEYNLAYGRDVAGLDVFGYTANDFNITEARWKQDVALCAQFMQPGRYLVFAGTEWNGNSSAGGDRNVIFFGDAIFPVQDSTTLRSFEWNEDMGAQGLVAGAWPVSRLHDAYRAQADNILMIPHVGGRRCNLDWHDPKLERLVEITSAWGHFHWFYQDAIERGYRVGASAAGDEHRGRPGGGAPGVDVFGVAGGVTGVIATELTPSTIQQALFNRHTFATTGKRHVALLSCDSAIQGDEINAGDAHAFRYRLLGDAGWEWIACYTNKGLLWEKNLHRSAGFSKTRFRVRWGGARIRDRYRWARWSGTIESPSMSLKLVQAFGLDHLEETVRQLSGNAIHIKTETYGDADGFIAEVPDIATLDLNIDLLIQSYAKTGSPLARAPHTPCPEVKLRVTGAELAAGDVHRELPGADLFVAVERITDQPLPAEIDATFTPASLEGITALYITARQVDDEKVWTSPIFLKH